jgi:hypothetical protein
MVQWKILGKYKSKVIHVATSACKKNIVDKK